MKRPMWNRDEFGCYSINSKDLAPKFPEAAIPDGEDFNYTVMVEKLNGTWTVFAEDHAPEDLQDFIGGTARFKKLADAKAAAEEFARFFAETLADAWANEKEQRVALYKDKDGNWGIPGFPVG